MKSTRRAIAFSLLALALSSCATFLPKPTETPSPTTTYTLTMTLTPKPTSSPTRKSTDTLSAPLLPMPSGTPATSWEGFPIMPNALAGEGDNKGYTFTIVASANEIQSYYENELAKLGSSLFASGQGTTNAILLIFMKGADLITLSIIPQPDGVMYVMLVK